MTARIDGSARIEVNRISVAAMLSSWPDTVNVVPSVATAENAGKFCSVLGPVSPSYGPEPSLFVTPSTARSMPTSPAAEPFE